MLTDEQMIEKARARGIADKASALFFGRTIEKLTLDDARFEYERALRLQRASWERRGEIQMPIHKPMDILVSCRQSMLSEESCDLQARCFSAANEIERLRAANAELRAGAPEQGQKS